MIILSNMINTTCVECGKTFGTYNCWLKRGGGKTCSKPCFSSFCAKKKGRLNPNFKLTANERECVFCKNIFKPHNKKSMYCSYRCKGKAQLGVKHPLYKKIVGYSTVHAWILRHHKKATKCQNEFCLGKSKNFEWALIKGKPCERDTKNFWQLCRFCHIIYDRKNYKISDPKDI